MISVDIDSISNDGFFDNAQHRERVLKNIELIGKRVARAAIASGRTPEQIKVIAVTKTISLQNMMPAIEEGMRFLGENRVQELVSKYEELQSINKELADKIEWHLLGHLQTNKVKYILDKVSLIHSLDSLELAQEIQKRSEKIGKVTDVLVQVNVAGEPTKFGIGIDQIDMFTEKLSQFKNINVKGMMTIGPYTQDTYEIRKNFRNLYKILVDIKRKNNDNNTMEFLSMGMSNDFEIAIEEGANIVRIGTAIFGSRI